MANFDLSGDDFFTPKENKPKKQIKEPKQKKATSQPKEEKTEDKKLLIDIDKLFSKEVEGVKNKKINFLITPEEHIFLKCLVYQLDLNGNVSTICRDAINYYINKVIKKDKEVYDLVVSDFYKKVEKENSKM